MPMVSAEGKFRARARSASLCESKNGTPQVAVVFEVSDDAHKGESITWYGFLTPAAMKRTLEGLRYTGWRGNDLGDLSGIGDAECEIVVQGEEWEGRTTLKVRWVNSPWKPAAMTPDRIKALIASTRAAALDSRSATDGTPEPPPLTDADRPGPGEDDLIPF